MSLVVCKAFEKSQPPKYRIYELWGQLGGKKNTKTELELKVKNLLAFQWGTSISDELDRQALPLPRPLKLGWQATENPSNISHLDSADGSFVYSISPISMSMLNLTINGPWQKLETNRGGLLSFSFFWFSGDQSEGPSRRSVGWYLMVASRIGPIGTLRGA